MCHSSRSSRYPEGGSRLFVKTPSQAVLRGACFWGCGAGWLPQPESATPGMGVTQRGLLRLVVLYKPSPYHISSQITPRSCLRWITAGQSTPQGGKQNGARSERVCEPGRVVVLSVPFRWAQGVRRADPVAPVLCGAPGRTPQPLRGVANVPCFFSPALVGSARGG